MQGSVAWSKHDPLEEGSANEDPLGFYAYALRLADEWLPGITTRTRRARYYSLVCAGLKLIEEELGDLVRRSANRDEERSRLILRWERLWALAFSVATPGAVTGFIGRKIIEPWRGELRVRTRSVDFPFIARQGDLGPLGAYKSSLEDLGLIRPGVLELTPDGERLARMTWAAASSRDWRRSAQALRTGRLCFPPAHSALTRFGERMGLIAIGSDERSFLRSRFFESDGRHARRSQVLAFLKGRRLGEKSEVEVLKVAARRVLRGGSGSDLERRAAAILGTEQLRSALVRALQVFREQLLSSGGAGRPDNLRDTDGLLRQVREAKSSFLRFAAGEFGHLFNGFAGFAKSLDTKVTSILVAQLLERHREAMRQRRTPVWFHPAGRNRWELDISVAKPADQENRPYSYRTENLKGLAKDVGVRV